MSFASGKKTIATCSIEKNIKIFDLTTCSFKTQVKCDDPLKNVAWSPNDKKVVAVGGGSFYLWNVDRGGEQV